MTAQSPDRCAIATKTLFGWTLSGSISSQEPGTPVLRISTEELETDVLLQQFRDLEKVAGESSPFTCEEQQAVSRFKDTHRVLLDGRFSVQLPRHSPTLSLGECRLIALRRHCQNERSLQRKHLLSQFREVLREYETLDHAECIPVSQLFRAPPSVYYLPVHGVTKEDSTTTKLKAVFDESAKTRSGVALMILSSQALTSTLISLQFYNDFGSTRLHLRQMCLRCSERLFWATLNETFIGSLRGNLKATSLNGE